MMERRLRWMRLDNAAKIYPAARSRSWTSIYRLSVTLTDDVVRSTLQEALNNTVRRFPSIAVRVRRGMFWYYLEEIRQAPKIDDEYAFPLVHMTFNDIRRCAFRVVAYKNRIAVEIFHAITDANGGMVFLKTLVAEYLRLHCGAEIPFTDGVLDIREEPRESELEDSFLKHYGPVKASRKDDNAYDLRGTPEPDRYLNVITGILDSDEVAALARSYGVSVTAFISAVMVQTIIGIQNERVPQRSRQLPVKIMMPVNLRRLFDSSTLRNFVLYITPGVDPRLGDYTFEEIVAAMHHQMGLELTDKQMAAKIAANVGMEQMFILRITPRFIKDIAMKFVYHLVGERKTCLSISNLGRITVPEEMKEYITRMEFVIGAQSVRKNNCAILSYDGKMYINFLRTIRESTLEREFFRSLRKMGLHIKIESNSR